MAQNIVSPVSSVSLGSAPMSIDDDTPGKIFHTMNTATLDQLRYPDHYADYEPSFGVEELHTLTLASILGHPILAAPISESAIKAAEDLIEDLDMIDLGRATKAEAAAMRRRQSACPVNPMIPDPPAKPVPAPRVGADKEPKARHSVYIPTSNPLCVRFPADPSPVSRKRLVSPELPNQGKMGNLLRFRFPADPIPVSKKRARGYEAPSQSKRARRNHGARSRKQKPF